MTKVIERIFTRDDFKELTESIQEHEYIYPPEDKDAKVFSPRFAVAIFAEEKIYMVNGESMYDLVFKAIKKIYPYFESEYQEMICDTIPAYLKKPLVMLEYLSDKQQRDYLLETILTLDERLLLDSSCTRATNIRNMYNVLYVVSLNYEVPEFEGITSIFLKYYNDQLHQIDDSIRTVNAISLKNIVYDFCMEIIKKASH